MWRGRILAYHTADSRYARRALSVFTAKAKISQMYIPRLAHWLCLDVKKPIGTIYIYIGMFSLIDVQVKPLGTIQTQSHQFFIQVLLESFLFSVRQLTKMGCTIKTCYKAIQLRPVSLFLTGTSQMFVVYLLKLHVFHVNSSHTR